jgi:hypothetical protein
MTVTARTTFMPWLAIEMEQGEYDSLLGQGLIVLDAPDPEADKTPAAPPAGTSSGGRGARGAADPASE